MVIDIAKYEHKKSFVIDYFRSRGRDIRRTISMCATIHMVPVIAVAYWIGEETNWHPDAVAAIKRIIEFYDYKDIQGKPPGSPL